MKNEGEADLSRLGNYNLGEVGPIRDGIKERAKKFLNIPTIEEILPSGTLEDIYSKLVNLTERQSGMLAIIDKIKAGEDTTIPIIERIKNHDGIISDNLKNITTVISNIGSFSDQSNCYANDKVIEINPNVKITMEGVFEGVTFAPPTTPGTTPGISIPYGIGSKDNGIFGFGIIKKPTMFSKKPLSTGDNAGILTFERNPFKTSLNSLTSGKPVFCQLGMINRRFDVVNQMIGGLETKIPPFDVLENMRTNLDKFMGIYDTIRLDFGFSPETWFENINQWRERLPTFNNDLILNKLNLDANSGRLTDLIARIDAFDLNLDSEIKKRIGTLSIPIDVWDSQIGSRILSFDYTALKDRVKWNAALDNWMAEHDISALGNISIKKKLDQFTEGLSLDSFKSRLDDVGLRTDLTVLRTTINSMDSHIQDIKKKFNNLRETAGTSLDGIKNRVGSSRELGIRGQLQKIRDRLTNLATINDVKVWLYTRGGTAITENLTIEAKYSIIITEIDVDRGTGKTVGGVTFEHLDTFIFKNIFAATAGADELIDAFASHYKTIFTADLRPPFHDFASGYRDKLKDFGINRLKNKIDEVKPDFNSMDSGLGDIFNISDISLPGDFEIRSLLPTGFGRLFGGIGVSPLS